MVTNSYRYKKRLTLSAVGCTMSTCSGELRLTTLVWWQSRELENSTLFLSRGKTSQDDGNNARKEKEKKGLTSTFDYAKIKTVEGDTLTGRRPLTLSVPINHSGLTTNALMLRPGKEFIPFSIMFSGEKEACQNSIICFR